MTHRSIRFRLTIFVSVIFACTLVVTGLLVRGQLQRSLEQEVQARATAALEEVFTSPDPAILPAELASLVFFDATGEQISAEEFDAIVRAEEALQPPLAASANVTMASEFVLPPEIAAQIEALMTVDAVSGQLQGTAIPVDLGPGTFTVASPIAVGELELGVGVTAPSGPIDSTVRAISIVGAFLIPLLTGLVALTTWMTASRALRPVEAIRLQVERTDFGRLDLRVPKPGTNDEIDRLAGTMNDMLDRLDRSAEQQRQFISDASHELRSPITATLATIESTGLCEPQDWPQLAKTIELEQHRLGGLVDDLLLLAQLDEMGVRLADDVDLDELALHQAARPHPCEVVAKVRAPQRVVGSERMLGRLVSNLVDNATRHANSRVEITVGSTIRGDAYVRVDDDGLGIPRERRVDVFGRFTRLDPARHGEGGGAGLGLAIAANIAEQHDASLVVTDSPLGGARFELLFPT